MFIFYIFIFLTKDKHKVEHKTTMEMLRDRANTNAAFTLNGSDDQKRKPTFVKMAFQVLKVKFLACSLKQAFYSLHKQNIAQAW